MIEEVLSKRRAELVLARERSESNIASWEKQIKASHNYIANYDREIAQIDRLLGVVGTQDTHTVTLTSDAPINVKGVNK